MTKSTRNGYLFEKEVQNGLEIEGIQVWKVPDSKAVGRVINVKAPADFIFSTGNKIYTIEAKQTKLPRIPWSNFREHQITWCLDNPDCALFIINFNNRRRGKDAVNECFMVNGHVMSYFIDEFDKSVPLQAFRDHAVTLDRKTGSHNPLGTGAFIDFEGVEL